MELVYLWVEDYKNIKRQGFNFSPRFECSYNEDTTELTIHEKQDYVNIFPDNINVTAIVGENGSGKSSIIECLAEIFRIEYNKNKNLVADYDHTFDFYLAFKIKDETYEIKSSNNRYTNSFESTEKVENILDYYVYSNNKSNMEKQILLDNSSIAKMIVHDYSKNKKFKLSSFMYLPNQIEINLCDFRKKFEELISNDQLYPMHHYEPDTVYLSNQSDSINTQMQSFEDIKDKYYQFLILKLLETSQETFDDYLSKEQIIEKLGDSELLSEEDFNQYFIFSQSPFNRKKRNIEKLTPTERNIYIEKYSDFFEFDFIDDKTRQYSDLSHGEKILFGQLLNVFYKSQISKIDNLLFLFDEPEISLHPNWQKSYIKELYTLLVKLEKNYHFLLASHSPFILSDIPKENVIFLEKDAKTGDCINITQEVYLNPFGANIHTLLSHGFFMKDGLMGEFAKEKIQSIIKYHEEILSKNLMKAENMQIREEEKEIYIKEHQKNFWNIQSIIGDDYLKQVIKNHLVEIEKILYKDMYLDNEIERMKKELKKLEALKNA